MSHHHCMMSVTCSFTVLALLLLLTDKVHYILSKKLFKRQSREHQRQRVKNIKFVECRKVLIFVFRYFTFVREALACAGRLRHPGIGRGGDAFSVTTRSTTSLDDDDVRKPTSSTLTLITLFRNGDYISKRRPV